MELTSIAQGITFSDKGYWVSSNEVEKISYTPNGHELIKESEQSSFWFHHRINCLNIVFDKFEIDSLLDIGGGNGEVSKVIQSRNVQTVLLEPTESGCINARQNGVNHVIKGTIKSAGIKNSSVPMAGLFDVLEHIEDDMEFLGDIRRILENEGRLILTVPAYQFLYSDFDKEVGHFRRYTLSELVRKLEASGFAIEYKTYFFSILPIPIALVRLFKFSRKNKVIQGKKKGHVNKESFLGKLLGGILQLELTVLKKMKTLPIGSSCLVVAKKTEKE